MDIILLADVKKVGRKHELATVADGFAQNVLLPQKLALPATPENLKRLRKEEGRVADKKTLSQSLLEKNIKELDGKELNMSVRANENGTLFKAIHVQDIAGGIEKEFGVVIPESSIAAEDIKKVGEYTIELSAGEAKARITISIG